MSITTQQFSNFIVALIKHLKNNLSLCSKEEQQSRILKCAKCNFRNKSNWTCQHPDCGCYLQLKVKWKSESCPIGSWDKLENQENSKNDCGCKGN